MRRIVLALAAVVLAACAARPGAGSGRDFSLRAFKEEIDARGIGFGVTRVPNMNALALQVRFKFSSAEEESAMLTEEVWREAAAAAAPEGCTLASLDAPDAEGARRAFYDCAG